MPNTPQTNQSPVANPNADDAERAKLAGLAKRRQSLKKKLDMHSAFTNALTLAMAAGGLYITGTALWGLKNTFFVDILSNLAFGTATSPGIPVAIAQAFLPTALASFAPVLAIGVPLILLAYMISYQINANRYLNAGKDNVNQPVATDTPDVTNSQQPQPDNNPAVKPNVDNGQAQQVTATPAAPAVSAPVQVQEEPAANEKSKPSKDNAKASEKKPQGSLAPVVFNHQRQTRSQTKAARAAAQHEHQHEAEAPKTRAAKRQSSKKNH